MDGQRVDPERGGMKQPKYSDDELRRELEANGHKLANWFTDSIGGALYRDGKGNLFAVADDDLGHALAVSDFLRRLGQVEK